MFRTAKAFRSPMVVLSIELRDRRRIVGHLRLHEPPGASYFWPALQQVSSTREPLVIPDITKHSLFGIGLQAPALAVRAFATIPLIAPAGRLVGAISLLDLQPQTLTASQLDLLLRAGRQDRRRARQLLQGRACGDRCARSLAVEGTMGRARAPGADRPRDGSFQPPRGRACARTRGRPCAAHAGPFSLALIDIDHFKLVNDRHGHAAGDEVLKQVSAILTSTFRASDLAVQMGR